MNSLSNIHTWTVLPVFLTVVPERKRDSLLRFTLPSSFWETSFHMPPGNLLVLLRQLPPTAPCPCSQGCFTLHCLIWAPASRSHLRFLSPTVFSVSRLLFNLQPWQVPSLLLPLTYTHASVWCSAFWTYRAHLSLLYSALLTGAPQ